ncbi:GntR family transcriptional regulator [Rhodobacter sp. NTK016B]|uniref:GntR family transcriptional regulator n=1 Tax=Rhodobacter sp. NTK016B TaxID=2759676 RepID=UPI001A8DC455|nr:GntR family transcriptional regulator [Rhodobacter sp. NTK016B]MBN8292700.1 GntR family transcriptional regulator [Rhodobacter sp. NTK016B]
MNALAPSSLRVDRTHKTLRAQVQDAIYDAILDGVLPPGQKIVERELCASTGVSRTIVREALARLEEKGLIGRDGANAMIVAVMTEGEVADIYELRAALEVLAARLFTQRADTAQMDAIAASSAELGEAFAKGHLADIRSATTRFYDILLDGSGNREIARSLNAMIDRIYFLRSQSMSDLDRHRDSLREMQSIADALLARDPEAAEKATQDHVAAAARAAQRQLCRLNKNGDPAE